MVDKIVVPLDGSETAEAILPVVERILARKDARLVLVQCVMPLAVDNAPALIEIGEAKARKYLGSIRERLEEKGIVAKTLFRIGPAAAEILATADEENAAMIAMATHGATGLKRFLLGSVAEQVLRRSPVPVLLVRPFWSYEVLPRRTEPAPALCRILVPFDREELARAALPAVTELADLFDAGLVLMRVMEPSEEKESAAGAIDRLREVAEPLERAAIPTELLVVRGKAAPSILKTAETKDIGIIALTTHGRKGLARLFRGSVTEEVLRSAKKPVLVIRAPRAKAGRSRKTAGAGRKA